MTNEYTPGTHQFRLKDNSSTSMTEYFFKRYKRKLVEKQPLLFVNQGPDRIFLPTQLCHEASLPKDFAKDGFKMSRLRSYIINNVQLRKERIEKLVAKFASDETLAKWSVCLEQNMLSLNAAKLREPSVSNGGQRPMTFAEFTNGKQRHAEPLKLGAGGWAFVYRGRDAETVNRFLETLHKFGGSLGMKFAGEPLWVEVPDDDELRKEHGVKGDLRKGGAFLHCIDNELDDQTLQKLSLAFVLVGREDEKARVKRFFDSKGVVTQFMLARNMQKKAENATVVTNILKQVNAKFPLDLYRINVPQKLLQANTMIVGVDARKAGRRTIMGMSASYSPHLTQHFTRVAYEALDAEQQKQGKSKAQQEQFHCQNRAAILAQFMKAAFQNYVAKNQGQ